MKKYNSLCIVSVLLLILTFFGNITVGNAINFSGGCITGVGSGCFRLCELIGNCDSIGGGSIMTVLQDVILTATFLVGTVLTIVLIYCGLMFIIQPGKSKQWKDGMIKSGIGALLVRGAYAIVQVIQYIAAG